MILSWFTRMMSTRTLVTPLTISISPTVAVEKQHQLFPQVLGILSVLFKGCASSNLVFIILWAAIGISMHGLVCFVQQVAPVITTLFALDARAIELFMIIILATWAVAIAKRKHALLDSQRKLQRSIEFCEDLMSDRVQILQKRVASSSLAALVGFSNETEATSSEEQQQHTDPSNKVDYSCPLLENTTYPIDHMRLNNFAGVASLDFNLDVFSKLDKYQQHVFSKFSEEISKVLETVEFVKTARDSEMFFQIPDEFTKLRFLQGDNYNIDLAVKRLVNCVQWRLTIGLDRFIECPDIKLLRRYRRLRVRRLVGIDAEGNPVVVERLGEFIASEESFRGGMTMEQWIMCYSYDASELMAAFRLCTERTGRHIHRMNYISDLSGAKLSGAFRLIPVLKIMTKAVEMNFPEIAGNLMFINAPSFAASIWSIAKRIIDPNTAKRISIFSGPSPDLLKELVGSAVLPLEFGGTNGYVVPHPVMRMDAEFERQFPLQ